MKFIYLPKVDSTNKYASKLLNNSASLDNNTTIYTLSQAEGRGLGKNLWFSEDNKNLIFSLIHFPNIEISSFFEISIKVSLAIIDYLSFKGINCSIKWPNDIYLQNKKICGILIENSFYADTIKSSIIGVGLNLNKNDFPDYLPNPVSLSDFTNQEYDIDLEIRTIVKFIVNFLNSDLKFDDLKNMYLNKLYRFGSFFDYIVDNKIVGLKIIDIESSGLLILEDLEAKVYKFNFKEIKYII